MTESYIYTGKKKVTTRPSPKPTDVLIDKASFIINISKPLEKKKSKGSVIFQRINSSEIIEYHLDCINRICINPQIIYITGVEHHKVVKHKRRSEFTIVENKFYDMTNSGTDLCVGVNAAMYSELFLLDGRFIPTVDTYRTVLTNRTQSISLIESKSDYDKIGVIYNKHKIITDYVYSSNFKLKGLTFLNSDDTNRLKNKIASPIHNNIYDFEVLKEFGIMITEDKTNSLLIPDNWMF